MTAFESAQTYLNAHKERLTRELCEFLRIPSVSTMPEHRDDMAHTANWLVERLSSLGMEKAEAFSTPGHPVVCAEWLHAPNKPTILVYGHYDVQPVDPIDEWRSDPFGAEIRDDFVYARGASDMKSQIFALFAALEALREGESTYPVNLKFMLEGEEEIGSPNLGDFMDKHLDMLACDAVLNVDSTVLGPDLPAIVYALRGLAYFELEVRGPAQDLHSGVFGGVVHNPAQVLCELIAGMHDKDGRVTLPGFYDKVRPLPDEEREALSKIPTTDDEWRRLAGAPALFGEKGYTATERAGARPALDVNGLYGGFMGKGSKTVLPARATAKLSVRLVPDQDEAEVYDQLCAYVRDSAPDTVTWEVRELSRGCGSVMDRHSCFMKCAVAALQEVFGAEPIFRREGGSIPLVGMMQRKLNVDTIMLGFGLPDDNIHGPNERQHLPTLFRGMEAYIRFLQKL